MLMQLIHGPTDLDRLRGAFNWKDGAVYFPPTHLTVSTYSLPLSHHGWQISLLTSLLRGSHKSGNLVIVKPKKWFKHPSWAPTPISLVLWRGGWAFIFWSNLINFGSSGSKVVWLIAKYDSNYRGTREISVLPEISSVCTSRSRGALCVWFTVEKRRYFKVFPKKASLGAGWKRRRPASDGWCLGEFELRGVNLVFDGEPAHDY